MSLWQKRFEKVLYYLQKENVHNVLELGCGEGKFLRYLAKNEFLEIKGIEKDEKRYRKAQKICNDYNSIKVINDSFLVIQCDLDCDAVVAIEVIEHLNKKKIQQLQRLLFQKIHPKLIILTTPNHEYNVHYKQLYGEMRHPDHKFEFTPSELNEWGNALQKKYQEYSYKIDFCDNAGASQMIIFRKVAKENGSN